MMFARTFENVAAGSPDAIAFEKEGSRLSYATLNTTANQIAKRLRDRGVRAGDRVGLYMAADFDLMAAVMAVLKTGAMCVPLDPFDPDERLQFYLKDCEPRCVVTKSPHAHSVPSRWHPYCLDEDRARLLGEPDENLEATPPPESPAFLFYTSGTTGTPKGVVQRHSELVTSYAWFRSYFDVTAGDCGVLKTPCNLVGFRGESLSMLPAGASTVILPVELRYDLKRLVQHLQRGGITLIRLTPSMLRVMLGLPEFTACQRLKHVVCAGEPLSAELEKRFLEEMPGATLHLCYGATEALGAVSRTCNVEHRRSVYNIGRPVDTARVHILSPDLKPVGTGEVGEICIGGSTVAQGYWNQPELTAKKFIRNPLGEDDTEYLYRTGDRGYILDDGQVAYLGRIDLQGNLRGIRVDYGEIESVLGMHPAIDSAVVTTRDDMADDQTLVAYYVRAPGTSAISASDLSTFLSAKLPAGLIPSCFLEVDGFRINRAGKVDRKSLPAPWEIENRTHARDVTPRTPLERQIAKIWKTLLKRDGMPCIHDAFNHLGGSSLLTVELVLRMESQFGVDLPLGDIIQRNTISQQAEFVERILAASTAGATRPADARQIDAVPSLAVRLPCRVSESQTTDPRARLDLPLVRFNQHTSGVPIVCCGGYTSVAAAFPDRPVLGLETGEGLMSASDIPYLARRYVDRLVAAGDKGPFILVGYSLGAEIAMELALELSGRGTRIPWLFLVDHPVLRHYPGRVVCMLASEGPYIELPESDNWEGALKDHFPGGADLVILTGDHIRIIRPCPTNPLFRQIRYRIESAPLDPGLDVTESCHGPQSDCDRFTRHSGARRHSRDGEAGAALKPVAWAEVGWDCMENGEYHNAVDAYRKALRQSPDFNWCNQLALSLEHLGDFEPAIDNWLQSMAIRPTSAYARINLAWAYYHRAEYEKALGACRFGRELDPWNLDVYLIERRCLSRLGHGDACRRLFDEVLARFSRLLFSQNRVSLLWFCGRDGCTQPVTTFEALENLTESYAIHLFHSACRQKRFCNGAEAVRMFEKILRTTRLKGLLAKSNFHLGELYLNQSRRQEAAHAFMNSLKWNPGHRMAARYLSQGMA